MTTYAREPVARAAADVRSSSTFPGAAAVAWSLPARVTFRLVFAYALLYSLPFPIEVLPKLEKVGDAWENRWHVVVPWVAAHVLRLPKAITVFSNGSGDTTYDYVKVLCFFALSVAVAAIWSLVDRRAHAYPRLADALRVYVRLVLGYTMLSYGFAKVLKSQFPFAPPDRLLEPYGESSPMGLLWTFMGHSTPYNVFTGGAEVLGGVLLFFRRTTTLGAIVIAGVMVNVVTLNFCYDVPVKLYSSHLLAMALALAIPDVRRLLNVLVLNRATEARPLSTPWKNRWLERARPITTTLFFAWCLYSTMADAAENVAERAKPVQSPVYGAWAVDDFLRDGVPASLSLAEPKAWRRVAFGRWIIVRTMDDVPLRLVNGLSEGKTTTKLEEADTEKEIGSLSYTMTDAEHLIVDATLNGAKIVAHLHREHREPLLVTRGFHWIQESPYNR